MQCEVPTPDYDDPKELFAFFGLTFYAAQLLEQGIVNLAVAARAAGNQQITPQLINDLYDSVDRNTFGQVLRIVRGTVSLPNEEVKGISPITSNWTYLLYLRFVP